MSDIVISVEHLGKKYRLHHQKERQRYVALRDVLADGAKSITRRLWSVVRGPALPSPSQEDFWALRGVSFEVKQGESVGIIGRNGAGKSTLLKILSRITEPTTGRITIRGRVASLLEVGTGFHPELTGRENVFLNGAVLGMTRGEIRRRFDDIVAFAEVEKFLDTPVKRYSSGMYVRLAFSVAAHVDPDILILDEVLAVGDTAFQQKCLGKMGDVAKRGRTVLFVSHNMGAVAELCPKCVLLVGGSVHSTGASKAVIKDYLTPTMSAGTGDLRNWHAERTGGGPMRVTSLAVCDASGHERSDFAYGEALHFHIGLSSDRARQCILALAIRDQEGQVILHLNNADDRVALLVLQGQSTAHASLAFNILNEGNYVVTVVLSDTLDALHDRVGNCLSLRINSQHQGSIRSQGAVRVAVMWSIASTPQA